MHYRATSILCAAAIVALAGCPQSKQKGAEPMAKKPKPAPRTLAPPPEESADKKVSEGEQHEIVTYTAHLDMDRLSGGKRLQATTITLDSGRQLIASYRPMKEYLEFVDRRVVVQGYHYENPPHVQQVMADHFAITSVKLAPGEQPYETRPTGLPTPPTVATRAEFEARDRRWVQLFATLKTGSQRPDDSWCDTLLTLPDGTELWASAYKTTFERVWKPLFGKQVSVIAQASIDKKDPKRPLKLVGQTAICEGKMERCGMGQDVYKRNSGPVKIR